MDQKLPTLYDQQVSPPRRLSVIFRQLSARDEASISIGEIRDALGDRSFAALLLLFAALNLLPLPIGSTLILGPRWCSWLFRWRSVTKRPGCRDG